MELHQVVPDRYKPLFVLGEGGMGRVEVALERGAAGFERLVALKRLLGREPRDERHVQMFLREARLAALLKHPNVVHAFAYGEMGGELFLAMQYVEGEPLSRVLAVAGRPLEPLFVAWVLADVCDGLHAAHELRDEAGKPLRVVHRDVSPHNVMIAYDGGVKVVDFGIARFETAAHATRTGEVKGKMAYMSPEQALGEELDRRSDIYSLGSVLYECLTGRRMWGQGTDLEIMRRLALEQPPRLDAVMPDLPAPLVELQARLVAHDRAARPGTVREVGDRLRAFAVGVGGVDSRRQVAATMNALFAEEARKRRDRLSAALQEAGRVATLALREDEEPRENPAGLATSRPRRAGRVVLAGLGATALGLAAAVGLARSTEAPAPSSLRPDAPRPTATPSEAMPTPAIAPAPAEVSPLGTNDAAGASESSRPPPSASARARPVAAPRSAPSARLPDVDPAPF